MIRKRIKQIFQFSELSKLLQKRETQKYIVQETILKKNKDKTDALSNWWRDMINDSTIDFKFEASDKNNNVKTKDILNLLKLNEEDTFQLRKKSLEQEKQLKKDINQEYLNEKNFRGIIKDTIPDSNQKQNDDHNSIKQQTNQKKEKVNEKKQQEPQKLKIEALPQHLQVRCLKTPNNESQIILIGLQRQSAQHSSYVNDLIHSLQPDIVLTQLSPDLPTFIVADKNEDFGELWKQFLEGKQNSNFYINPSPQMFQETIFNQKKIEMLLERNVSRSKDFQVDSIGIKEKLFSDEEAFIYDVLKQPFLYSYNNPQKKINVSLIGYPEIKYRNILASSIPFKIIYDLYKQKIQAQKDGKQNFDPLLIRRDLFIKPKINYEIEIMKQSILTYEKVICLVDNNSVEEIEETWNNSKFTREIKNLNVFLKQAEEQTSRLELSFEDHIKSLVALDLLISPFIQNNFVCHNVIPILERDQNEKIINRHYACVLWRNWWEKIQGQKSGFQYHDEKLTTNYDLK